MTQKPSPGRVVLVVGTLAESNGCAVAPAVVTRVWGNEVDGAWRVNLTIFPDNASPRLASSALLVADEATARAGLPHFAIAYWPPRV